MNFEPNGLPTLIGSLPLKDHKEAVELILKYTPEIPLWPQLPVFEEERLLSQFSEGLPGLVKKANKVFFDTNSPDFEGELLSFFEDYLAVTEGGKPLDGSRFSFSERTSRGFDTFLEMVKGLSPLPFALKGQITGPFTMLTGLKDQDGKLIYFHPMLKDAVIKAVTLKACFQVVKMKEIGTRVILFLDEPALSGFGSSAMVGITRDEVLSDLKAVVSEVKSKGALCGIHVCANTDWSLVLDAGIDILSFDAYGFFEKFILYKEKIVGFLEEGGVVAWGLVPTLNPDDLKKETIDSLFERWKEQNRILGLDEEFIRKRALITPSCGTGLLTIELAEKALSLTKELSERIRAT